MSNIDYAWGSWSFLILSLTIVSYLFWLWRAWCFVSTISSNSPFLDLIESWVIVIVLSLNFWKYIERVFVQKWWLGLIEIFFMLSNCIQLFLLILWSLFPCLSPSISRFINWTWKMVENFPLRFFTNLESFLSFRMCEILNLLGLV